MSGRKLRPLEFRLVATAGAALLTLTTIFNVALAYGKTINAAAPPTTRVMDTSTLPIHLTSNDIPSDLPPLGAFNFDFTVPGLGTFDIYDTGAVLPTDYGYGLTFVGEGISFTGESQGTSAGLSSTVSMQMATGGFSNTESYGTNYWGLACIICNEFQMTDPGGADTITADTDIFTNGELQFDLTTPLGTFDFGPSSGTMSALAESLTALSPLASDPASSLTDFLDLPSLI